MKYIALLRGINVGGNNKVSMTDLKKAFESLGFTNVVSYINSGNIIFDTDVLDVVELTIRCEKVIEDTFGFHVVCAVIAAQALRDASAHAPDWWGLDNDDKHNAIFVIAPQTANAIIEEVGVAKLEYEKIAAYGPVIFWSAPLKTFGRTRYSKIVGTSSYKFVTIRNANTFRKLVDLTA